MEVTGLPSSTVYPTLRRLEQQELIKSTRERASTAYAEQRHARKYYLSHRGKDVLAEALQRYSLLEKS